MLQVEETRGYLDFIQNNIFDIGLVQQADDLGRPVEREGHPGVCVTFFGNEIPLDEAVVAEQVLEMVLRGPASSAKPKRSEGLGQVSGERSDPRASDPRDAEVRKGFLAVLSQLLGSPVITRSDCQVFPCDRRNLVHSTIPPPLESPRASNEDLLAPPPI